jgi:putative tricarboxylic transport membrane protein
MLTQRRKIMKKSLDRRTMLSLTTAMVAAAGMLAPAVLHADTDYPDRPINVIVPFDTGGYNDRLARAMAPYIQEELGQPINIINRGGAGAMLGHTFFMQQPDDGYTIMLTSAAPYIPLNIYVQDATFTVEDFHMINLPSRDYTLMATAADSGIESVEEVIEQLRENPTSLSIGIQPASADLVNLMLFLEANEIETENLRLVTYDGGGPARNATAGNVVDIGLVGGEGFLPLREQVRPLVIFDSESRDDWDGPPVTEVVGEDAEYVAGSQRGWVVHSTFVENHPERYQRLVEALEAATAAAQESLETQQLARTWYGPEDSNEAFRRTAQVMEQHIELLEGGY